MKVLHLSTFDTIGGAARAAYRIHQGLCELGTDSQMLVRKKASSDPSVIAPKTIFGRLAGRIRAELDGLALRSYPHVNPATFDIQKVPDFLLPQIQQINPEIINLHWILNSYLQIETLSRLKQPLVWTLHDMWPFTGGCHYSNNCNRYERSCGQCPQLNANKNDDLSREVWHRKQTAWAGKNLTIVAPSHWLGDCARKSPLFHQHRIEVIQHGLDTNTFHPIDKKAARQAFNLPQESHLVLFGAVSATKDQRKGFRFLQSALQHLKQVELNKPLELVVFGASQPKEPDDIGFTTHYLGHFNDDNALALVYSAADVMVVPSIQEAFGQTAVEALACKTPVAAFEATGLKDIVDHEENGYLAAPFDSQDLARGIAWILSDLDRHYKLCEQARQKVEQEFSVTLQAERYLYLYKDILEQFNKF